MARPSPDALHLAGALATALALSACGEPGVATPMPEPPTIDVDGVLGRETAGTTDAHAPDVVAVTFETGPGATSPGALIRTTNLDSGEAPTQSFARADGSFGITAHAAPGDTLRLQAVKDGLRGPPIDITYVDTSTFTPVSRPTCVEITPGLAVSLDAASADVDLTFTNACDGPIAVTRPRTRLGLGAFELDAALPVTLEPGDRTSIGVVFAPGSSDVEDVFFVDVATEPSQTVRYPITLFGSSE